MNVVWLQQTETQIPQGVEWLSLAERCHLCGLRFPKRRCDWRLGRWTAKSAVALYLGCALPAAPRYVEIWPDLAGAPEVFIGGYRAGFSISLSHRAGAAMAAIAPSGGAVGCDLECIEPHSDLFVADYFTPEEQGLIRRSRACDQAALVSLLWSAKESALKALHLGLRVDTRSLLVSFAGKAATTWNDLDCREEQGWHGFTVRLSSGPTLSGCWQRSVNLVRTVVADAALLPPAWLEVAIERCGPAHSGHHFPVMHNSHAAVPFITGCKLAPG